MKVKKKISILYIEDDRDDVELLEESLNNHKVDFEMNVIPDGKEGIDSLHRLTDLPDIILLDYNLPKVHGREILKEIKSLSILQQVPVIILTTSSSQIDIDNAYENGASKYIIKPTTMEGIRKTIESIVDLAVK